jgi:hypothetical protein
VLEKRLSFASFQNFEFAMTQTDSSPAGNRAKNLSATTDYTNIAIGTITFHETDGMRPILHSPREDVFVLPVTFGCPTFAIDITAPDWELSDRLQF